MMDPPPSTTTDGPDASSIKPVSSLRAQFENLNKANEPASPNPLPPNRVASPAPTPKPVHLRDNAVLDAKDLRQPAIIPNKPKALNAPPVDPPAINGHGRRSPTRPQPIPPVSPLPIRPPPPPVSVDPPLLSPPRSSSSRPTVSDLSKMPNSDSSLAIKPPINQSLGPKPIVSPFRPQSPPSDSRKSPRLSSSMPPSPPPPRRGGGGDAKKDRETKSVAPPINRADKPSALSHVGLANGCALDTSRRQIATETTPFTTPPSSRAGSDDGDPPPPTLPERPRPRSQIQPPPPLTQKPPPPNLDPPKSSKFAQAGFEPPPLHPSIALKRRERDDAAAAAESGKLTSPPPQRSAESRPLPPPSRPPTIATPERSLTLRSGPSPMLPPPRPPRHGAGASNTGEFDDVIQGQKRVVSSPTPPPQPSSQPRSLGRSMTVDRTSSRIPTEFRMSPNSISSVMATNSRTTTTTLPTAAVLSPKADSSSTTTVFPDSSNTNRKPPYIKQGVHEIHTKHDSRMFDVCGDLVCTTGSFTRVWSLLDGSIIMSLSLGEGLRGTAVAFRPGLNVDEEGARIWIGSSLGELMEVDIASQSIVCHKPAAHARNEIIKIYRHYNELWTLDETGILLVWGPDENGVPQLPRGPHQSFRVPKGHSCSMVVGDELWFATGKSIHIFRPTVDSTTRFQFLLRPLTHDGAGEVTSGTILPADPTKVLIGHIDGKVSIYSTRDYTYLGLINISAYKISSMAATGKLLWAGYNTGKICVYDMCQTPWTVKKEWHAHENPVMKLIADQSAFYKLDRHQVISLGGDNMLRVWDGLLQDDWLEGEMKARDNQYCSFEEIKALVLTWNAGASMPNSLRYSESDASFIQNLLQSSGSPDLLVFGFQELVDLEDKKATAKRFLSKPKKKKEGSDQDRMAHQYRDWRDFLTRSLDDYMAGDLYHLLHSAPLVGLFTCIFVKAHLHTRIHNLHSAQVKRGMGGLHGNKGAIVTRFMVDDTSLCFINCHLAAGQSQTSHRNNDLAAILDSAVFPAERDPSIRVDSYVGGGDGSMILDHELCVLNGDLNYRIDTMSRDTVVAAVKAQNLAKLLDRDQLLVTRRRNATFRLRAFDELPITFAPTYKYDVGTDDYDTSEKKRSPAWCDRLLFRGGGRIQQLDYRRHEVRVSDHRPVTGSFRFTLKKISPKRRAVVWMECQQELEDLRAMDMEDGMLYYLTNIIGYELATAKQLIADKADIRLHNGVGASASGHKSSTHAAEC